MLTVFVFADNLGYLQSGNRLYHQHIQQTIEKKLLQAYKKLGKKLYGKMIWPILANVLTVAALVGIVVLIVCLFRFLGAEAVLAAMI